jgi:hypothetical protein
MHLLFPLLPLIMKVFPPSFLQFMINLIPLPALHELRGHIDFTDATAAKLVRSRKAALASGKPDLEINGGKDIMSILGIQQLIHSHHPY